MYAYYTFQDLGFAIKKSIIDKNNYKRGFSRDEDGYLIVGNIYRRGLADKIKIGDSIISIDGVDIKDKDGNEFYDFLNNEDRGDMTVVFRSKEGDDYTTKLKNEFSFLLLVITNLGFIY